MTLVALTQEPEVKVRLAMIGKWCSDSCIMRRSEGGAYDPWPEEHCALYGELTQPNERGAPTRDGYGCLRHPACIAAHGGAE